MTDSASPLHNRTGVLAIMHQKERVIAPILAEQLALCGSPTELTLAVTQRCKSATLAS